MPNIKEKDILQKAIDALRRTTGFDGRIVEWEPIAAGGMRRPDAYIEIEAHGQRYRYVAEVKRVDRFAILVDYKNQMGQHTDQLLLVVPKITTEIADRCRELDLQFIDVSGNAYLHGLGLFVLIKGQRPLEGENLQLAGPEGKRAGTATALRVVFALLCKPELLNAPYRDINQVAGVALGAIGWIFFDLNTRGYTVGGKGKGDRVLLERLRLVQEWVTNYPIKLRPKLNPRRFRAPTADWWKTVDVTRFGAQWGGEVAAEKLTGHLRPHTCTLYFHGNDGQKNLTRLVVAQKLRADLQGDIEILDAFWDFDLNEQMQETVPPLLVYADLLATLDPRNLETAKIIYDQYLAAPAN